MQKGNFLAAALTGDKVLQNGEKVQTSNCTSVCLSVRLPDPFSGPQAPLAGRQTPLAGLQTPLTGRQTPLAGRQTPLAGPLTPLAGPQTPLTGPLTPMAGPHTLWVWQDFRPLCQALRLLWLALRTL